MKLGHFVFLIFVCIPKMAEMESSSKMRVIIAKNEQPEGMQIVELERPTITSSQVLIQVFYSAVNRADILQRKGKYNPPPSASPIIGLEVSGIIKKVGTDVKKWAVNDKVIALANGGGYAEYIAVESGHVMALPDGLSLRQGAAIPEAWLTGYQLLHMIGKAEEGDWVLIHAAGSGVGTALMQMCSLGNLNAFVTVGSDEKLSRCIQLGAKGGANRKSSNFDFAKALHDANEGKGANLILDPVGGAYWDMNSRAAAVEGRWVVYGGLSGWNFPINSNMATILRKRLKIEGTTLRPRSIEYKSELVSQFSERILPHFAGRNASLETIIDSEFSFENVAEAHQHMEANKNIGKIILTWDTASKDEL